MCRIFLISCLLMLACEVAVTAQDPQFSQFYAAPLYLNPALAGSTGQARAGLNYRNQWPSMGANFTTTSAYFDYFIEDKNSGVGVLLTQDKSSLANLQSLSLSAQYSYELKITDQLGFRPGFQAAVYNRNVNFSSLTFASQYDPSTGKFSNGLPGDPSAANGNNKTFLDLSAGGVLFTRVAWLGFAANHLNRPNQSIVGDQRSPLPIKYSVHGGFKFYMKSGVSKTYARPMERSVAPAVQYRHQGQFDQMDVGLYFTFEPIVIGSWYRGIPFKNVNGYLNNESIVLLIGFVKLGAKDALNIGYSYDYTISKLGPGSGGAHELSLVYTWPMRNPRKPPKDKLIIPCPDF